MQASGRWGAFSVSGLVREVIADLLADIAAQAASRRGEALHLFDVAAAGPAVVIGVDVAVVEADPDVVRAELVGDHARFAAEIPVGLHSYP